MLLPATYETALFLMILSMFCWGSWANTLKLCPGYRFQLFYWDYTLGLLLATVVWGFTAGSMGPRGPSFLDAVTHAQPHAILFALAGGVVFNIANLLLVAAIEVAGLAVAFPVGIGLALVIGAVSSYLIAPAANPLLLFGGVALVSVAIVLDAAAYRKRDADAKAATTRGIVLSLVAGVLMGGWYPIATRDLARDAGPGPYAIAFFFALGVAALHHSRQPAADGQTAGRQAAGGWIGLWPRALRLAPGGNLRWGGLVRGRGGQLHCLGGASGQTHRPGSLLLHRPGSHHDFGLLGRLYLARVCLGAAGRAHAALLHVCLLPGGTQRGRAGAALLTLRTDS